MSQKIDLENAIKGAKDISNFHFLLFKLIGKADFRNKHLLYKGFPNAVDMYESYIETGEIGKDLPYD